MVHHHHHRRSLALLAILTPFVMSRKLFVGSYGGSISTYDFSDSKLTLLHSTESSKPAPSWQEVRGDILYTVEETNPENNETGALASYRINAEDGSLGFISRAKGKLLPVSLAVSGDGKTIFTANYGSASTSVFTNTNGTLTHNQDNTYTLPSPGPDTDRQDTSYPHQALFDPTGQFIVIPDLGADLLRIYHISPTKITSQPWISTKFGTGPRHGTFYPPSSPSSEKKPATHYFLVNELSNTLTAFAVQYSPDNQTLYMHEIQTISTFPKKYKFPKSSPAPAEIVVSPDGKFVYVSNRNDATFSTKSKKNGKQVQKRTDSIAVFGVNANAANNAANNVANNSKGGGVLTFLQLADSKVKNPRYIGIDPQNPGLLWVAGQDSQDLVALKRNGATGMVEGKNPVVAVEVKGGPVCVSWEE